MVTVPLAAFGAWQVARTRTFQFILLHGMYPGREETRKAVGPVIDRLRAQGYRFVTVPELIPAV